MHGGRSSTLFPSAKDPRKRKIARFPVIGKVICWPEERTATLRHWCHADQGARQRNGSCGCCLESARSQTPGYAATFADLGPRTGDGQTQGLHGSYRCAGVFLRSTESLAARLERKHKWLITTILPYGNRPVCLLASAARPGLAALKSASKRDFGISNSGE